MAESTPSAPARSRVRTHVEQSTVVARKEFTAAVRARSLQVLFVLLVVATGVVFRAVDGSAESPATVAVELLGLPVQLIVPIAAILAASSAVAGERESGSLRVLLGMPVSRTEVVVGKFLGLFGALSVGLGVMFVVAVSMSLITYGTVPLSALAGLIGGALLLAGAFGGFAVGVSAAVATTRGSLAATVGGLFTLSFLWEPLVAGTYYAVAGTLPAEPVPAWLLFVERLNPLNAFAVAAGMLDAGAVYPLRVTFGLLRYDIGTILTGGGGTVPVYISDPVSLVVLLGWIVVPLAVGVARFRSVDLT